MRKEREIVTKRNVKIHTLNLLVILASKLKGKIRNKNKNMRGKG
jgi:hypothetical protein